MVSDSEADTRESSVIVVKQLTTSKRKTRSFASVPDELQGLCYIAHTWVTDFTLFGNPFLNAMDMINMVHQAWEFAQDTEQNWAKRTDECGTMVNKHKPSPPYNFP